MLSPQQLDLLTNLGAPAFIKLKPHSDASSCLQNNKQLGAEGITTLAPALKQMTGLLKLDLVS